MSLNLCVCAPRRAPPRPRAPPRGTQSASASGPPTPACAPEAAPPEAVRSPSAWSMHPRHVSSVQRARDELSPCHPPIEQHVPPRQSPPLLPFLLCMQRRPARPHTAYKSCKLCPHTCTPGRRLPEPCRPSIGALREARPLDPKHGHSTILVHPLDPTGAHVVVCC
jgi:hypothetical protein